MSGIIIGPQGGPMTSPQAPPQGAPVQVGNFDGNTRLLRIPLAPATGLTSGQIMQRTLPRNGLLRAIGAEVDLTITGTPGTPNPIGQAVTLKNIRLYQGTSNAVVDITGAGYFYGLAYGLELGQDVAAFTTGRSAVAATTTGRLDFWIPVTPNLRDAVGLINLQSRQQTWNFDVQLDTDATVSGSVATMSVSIYPYMEIFTIPDNPINLPPDNYLQRYLEEVRTYTGAIQQTYAPLVGDVYLQIYLMIGGDLVTGVDNFSDTTMRFNQSSYVMPAMRPGQLDGIFRKEHLGNRPKGLWIYDFLSSAGLGNYDKLRDTVDSKKVSDFELLWTQTVTPLNVRILRRVMTKVG